jgi:diguanylate cyclase (GGDEF)-like protein
MTTKPRLSVNVFVFGLFVAALAALAYDAWASQGQRLLGHRPAIMAMFTVCCVATELRPLHWLRREEGGQVTAGWTFMMALLLVGSPIAVVAIVAAAFFVGDVASRKPAVKILFNSAQIVVCLSLGAAVFNLTGQQQALVLRSNPSLEWFGAFVVASAVMFVVNDALTCTVIALHQGLPVAQMLRSHGTMNLSTDGVLLSMSPIFVVVAQRSVFLVPLVLLTTWTVYRTAELALVRRHEATHDTLTKLANRRLFDEHLRSAVLSAQRGGRRVGIVLVDLDGFKGINDRLGHDIGDQVLRDVAARMNNVRRSSDLLARIGGDEFALVLSRLDSVATATAVAERMRATFSHPCVVEGFPVSVQASFGVAVLPDHAQDWESLLRRADETMYSAKDVGHGLVVCEPQSDERGTGRTGLLADVSGALKADEFFLEYQPQVSLASGRAVGVEALVRWRHPVAGVLYPAEFIGLAEQTELMGSITERVLREALAQCASWQRQGQHLRVAVNISARNMHDVRFPELVGRLIKEAGVVPGNIELEITENTVDLDRATVHSVLRKLRATGASVSIDDFGTGFSSMAQLRELPVDRIKIDRSFVTNMASEARDALIVGAIVRLGQALGIETVAEGVEDASVAEMLLDLGCTTAQGWLFGKPVSPEAIGQHLWGGTLDLSPGIGLQTVLP